MSANPSPNSDRAECLAIITRLEGPGGVAAFLRTSQPDLEGATGAELLQSDPAALLRRLKALEIEKSLAVIDDELDEHITIDPYVSGTNSRRSDKEIAHMLALLDSLDTGKDGSH